MGHTNDEIYLKLAELIAKLCYVHAQKTCPVGETVEPGPFIEHNHSWPFESLVGDLEALGILVQLPRNGTIFAFIRSPDEFLTTIRANRHRRLRPSLDELKTFLVDLLQWGCDEAYSETHQAWLMARRLGLCTDADKWTIAAQPYERSRSG